MKSIMTIMLCCLFFSGCVAWTVRSKSSDEAWIEEEPEHVEEEGARLPPGKDATLFSISPGVFSSLGVYIPVGDGSADFTANFGMDLTLLLAKGRVEGPPVYSMRDDQRVTMDWGIALKTGLTFVGLQEQLFDRMFSEVSYTRAGTPAFLFGGGLGWIGDLGTGHHGVMGSFYASFFYVRVQHIVNQSTEVLFGLNLTYPFIFAFEK